MENILVKDVLPYMKIWTSIIIVFLFSVLFYLKKFKKHHPEIFQSDTTADNKRWLKQKAELRRQYHNMARLGLIASFVWIIGMMLICLHFAPLGRGWFLLVIALCAILWVLSLMQRKSKE